MIGRGKGTRPRRVEPQVVGLNVLSVGDVMEASAGRLWELAPVVARWITQLGTVQGRNKAADRAQVGVIPGDVTIVGRRDISNENVPNFKQNRRRAAGRQVSQARAGARPLRQGFTSCPRTRTKRNRSSRSPVITLSLFFFNSVELHGTEPRTD